MGTRSTGNEVIEMQVVKLDTPNLRDVPASLRRLAEQIENGEEPNSTHAIVVSEGSDGKIDIYHFGDIGRVATEVGLLQMAVMKLSIEQR